MNPLVYTFLVLGFVWAVIAGAVYAEDYAYYKMRAPLPRYAGGSAFISVVCLLAALVAVWL